MDFSIPAELAAELADFDVFLKKKVSPNLQAWNREGIVPRSFLQMMGMAGWYGYRWQDERLIKRPGLRETLLLERIAKLSPGVAVTVLIISDLGLTALNHFGTDGQLERFGEAAVRGECLICFGNTENLAGSDAAGITMSAEKTNGGWVLKGSKAYTTNGLISDLAVVTAVTEPEAPRNRRISMFLVELDSKGISRKKLNKQVWIPSDLSRIEFDHVFVPDDHLMGNQGKGLQQTLTVFTNSRIPISGLALGTAAGAFDLALQRARSRTVFGRPIAEFQSKAFEIADFYARLEAARLVVYHAAAAMDSGADFRFEASLAKYLAVQIAKELCPWAADLFGAASVVREHPVHKFPMDAWAVSLAEGTQDVQKLVIFREIMKKRFQIDG
ncbi:MAG: acyl-CoA dehydrogenase family protein [Desulfobacterales bacterium]|jgi:alkylation response protein AidB-like acyl-CoA dehydrogenase